MSKVKAHRKARIRGRVEQSKLRHDILAAKTETSLHNHQGGGALPSQLGWGQHKSKKANVSLFDPFKGG